MPRSQDWDSVVDLGKGDHRVYTHPSLSHPVVVDPNRPHLKRYVVLNALAAIDELEDEED
ncbi:MAG: hypothetical protein M3069_19460 [Chloroflexota bacterium]|nr:hypothetical protein [Chloroflexota bacterium]